MAAGEEELVAGLLDKLAGLAPVAVRRIFGGVGLYSGRRLFGLVQGGSLYLRADEGMRRDLARLGAAPFRRGRVVTAFWEVPPALTGDKRRVRALARRALAATEQAGPFARPSPRRKPGRIVLIPPAVRRPRRR